MLNFKTGKSRLGLVILISAMMTSPIALANDISEAKARMEALSYAPEGSNLNERFSQFQFETDEYAEHELNDAWLGMPAYSSEGKLIGYIEDAFLDENGDIAEILVGLNENQGIVEIKSKFAELNDERVKFKFSTAQIAELANQYKLASFAE